MLQDSLHADGEHHAEASTGSHMSPLTSSLHEDSDLQQDSEGQPDSSDPHPEGSEGGDEGGDLGDEAHSALQTHSAASGQVRPAVQRSEGSG